jgi:AraC-like DNA-binding protein
MRGTLGGSDPRRLERLCRPTLELLAGIDRFTIARQFRLAYGTSPSRYQTTRRLDLARSAIQAGPPLAQAAADAGFPDQSHLTRHAELDDEGVLIADNQR